MRMERLALGIALLTTTAQGQETARVSVDSSGAQANDVTYHQTISADGRFVAFVSLASNLVPGDSNGAFDAFVHDRTTGVTERVSVDSAGVAGNGDCDPSDYLSLSADGRFVAFSSYATNLVSGDTNGSSDVFVHDRSTGTTERVSVNRSGVEGNGHSFDPSLSADGEVVAFTSYASNLVARDKSGYADVFVHDRSTGSTKRVSVDSSGLAGSGDSVHPSLSANGQIVAFSSLAPDLVPGDTNGHADAFVHDRATGVTERVSVASTGAEGNDGSWADSISADGQIVAFYGWSSNLVAGDANGVSDVFVRDRTHGLTERVSVDSTGAEATDHSYYPSLSADGRIVAFWSLAANLVAGDTNGRGDVFVRDRSTGTTERDSVDASGAEGDDHSYEPALSARGVIVAFCSAATNLVAGDTNGVIDVFVHHRRIDATWFPYGTGWPGTLGAPDAASSGDPVLGTSITITITNSLGADTPGVVLVGLAQANLPTGKDGTLLVVPLLYIPLLVPSAGAALNVTIPDHDSLSGLEVDLQTLELDAGASKGVSFTRGLKLVLGQ